MGSLNPFKKPKTPKPPPVPTIDEARQDQDNQDRLRRRRGTAANILTGRLGDPSQPAIAVKTLLGG